MREDVKHAVLEMYKQIAKAREVQSERGKADQGGRMGITSGKHLNAVAEIIKRDLIKIGLSPDKIFDKGKMCTLPGWFRPTKDWDILAFEKNRLVAAIELKSISSSFGNNANNRSEESIGSAYDALTAYKENLFGNENIPPAIGYVMIVKSCEESQGGRRLYKTSHFPVDKVFQNISYLERFKILCQRLRRKSLYQAVWLVYVDPDSNSVTEPDPDMTYEKFLAILKFSYDIRK